MTRPASHTVRTWQRAAIAGLAMALLYCDALARGELGGRMDLSYQKFENSNFQEQFGQRYQVHFKDRLFEQNDFRVMFFLDSYKNLTTDRTLRQYWFQLDLNHRFYTFNGRFTPEQRFTPLQLDIGEDRSENRLYLDVHVPKAPRVRLSYTKARRLIVTEFNANEFKGDVEDIRGEISYAYKFFNVRLDRLHTKTGGPEKSRTTIATGGTVILNQSWNSTHNSLTASGMYDYRLTENTNIVNVQQDVTNQTFSGLLTGRYRRWTTATLSARTRRLKSVLLNIDRQRNDDMLALVRFFPFSPVKLDFSRTYLLTQTDLTKMLADYFTAQVIVDHQLFQGTTGRFQLAAREDIASENGIVPPDLAFLAFRSHMYEGVDGRMEISVAKRNDASAQISTYQSSTLFDFFLKPRDNLDLIPSVQWVNFSDNISFIHNDRQTTTLNMNYFAHGSLNMGFILSRTRISSGSKRNSNAATFSMGMRLRGRSTVNLSYGFNELDVLKEEAQLNGVVDSRANTLNVHFQFWLTAKGLISFNFIDVARREAENTRNINVNFRLNF